MSTTAERYIMIRRKISVSELEAESLSSEKNVKKFIEEILGTLFKVYSLERILKEIGLNIERNCAKVCPDYLLFGVIDNKPVVLIAELDWSENEIKRHLPKLVKVLDIFAYIYQEGHMACVKELLGKLYNMYPDRYVIEMPVSLSIKEQIIELKLAIEEIPFAYSFISQIVKKYLLEPILSKTRAAKVLSPIIKDIFIGVLYSSDRLIKRQLRNVIMEIQCQCQYTEKRIHDMPEIMNLLNNLVRILTIKN